MSYVVLARRWRPMEFEDVIGQEHVTRTLVNALKNTRIAHAYIFAGPRGVGKTTTARLLAKAVNCEKQPAVNPCNECNNCKTITSGQSMDVLEIDGASNRGIDEIRNLRENIRFAPASFKYKIYIIDEVHMLTKEAFNALLKTLEEPPSHAIFIFATTEIHKVPLTILSRCQRFDFKRISLTKIKEMLKKIVDAEGIKISEDALAMIARKADGSMRDAESVMDQMISYSDGEITAEQVSQTLGLLPQEVYFELSALIDQKNTRDILKFAQKITNTGHDILDFIQGLKEHYRNYLLLMSVDDPQILDVADYLLKNYRDSVAGLREMDILHYLQIITNTEAELKFSTFPQLTFEMLLLKMCHKPASVDIEKVLAFIDEARQNPELMSLSAVKKSIETPKTPPPTTDSTPGMVRESAPRPAPAPVTQSSAGQTGLFSGLSKSADKIKKKVNPTPGVPDVASGPATGQATLELTGITERWPEIIDFFKKEKIALGSFLEEGVPFKLEEGGLVLAYDENASFHQEHVAGEKSHIETVLKKNFGLDISLKFETINFAEHGIAMTPKTPEEILDDIKSKEPIIQKIINAFDLDELNKKSI